MVTIVARERGHGGTPPSYHLGRAYELLADGEWHDYYPILVAVATAVHPSLAYRQVVSRRKTEPRDEEERNNTVRSGQREIARETLDRRSRFEHRWVGDKRQIRLLPFTVSSDEKWSERAKRGWETKRQREQDQSKPSSSSSGDA